MQLANDVTANLVASFEARSQYICDVAIHGSEGVLVLPDPNAFGGTVRLKRGRGGWGERPCAVGVVRDVEDPAAHPLEAPGQPHRASGELGAHVVEAARGILTSAAEGRIVAIESRVEQPQPLPVDSVA